jgi:FixJ family two-component response regulator
LLIDDDERVRAAVAVLLRQLGYECATAASAQLAIETYVRARATPHPFGCVLVDLNLGGGVGGAEVVEGFNTLDPKLPIVVITGTPHEVDAATRARVRAVLEKPFETASLVRVLALAKS